MKININYIIFAIKNNYDKLLYYSTEKSNVIILKTLIEQRCQEYSAYDRAKGQERYDLRKIWLKTDRQILAEFQERISIKKANEFDRPYWMIKTDDEKIKSVLRNQNWRYEPFTDAFYKLVSDNSLYRLVKALYL